MEQSGVLVQLRFYLAIPKLEDSKLDLLFVIQLNISTKVYNLLIKKSHIPPNQTETKIN